MWKRWRTLEGIRYYLQTGVLMADAQIPLLDAIRRRLREWKEAMEGALAPPMEPVPVPVPGRRPRRRKK